VQGRGVNTGGYIFIVILIGLLMAMVTIWTGRKYLLYATVWINPPKLA